MRLSSMKESRLQVSQKTHSVSVTVKLRLIDIWHGYGIPHMSMVRKSSLPPYDRQSDSIC